MCSKIGRVLLIVGGLNWGVFGVGLLMGSEINVVNMLLGKWPMVEGLVYVLVGLSALIKMFGCKCKKCKEACMACCAEEGKMEEKM
ncbi:MAG: DUF378 domain-containing protein [Candidatus Paceibacterota bacterium]